MLKSSQICSWMKLGELILIEKKFILLLISLKEVLQADFSRYCAENWVWKHNTRNSFVHYIFGLTQWRSVSVSLVKQHLLKQHHVLRTTHEWSEFWNLSSSNEWRPCLSIVQSSCIIRKSGKSADWFDVLSKPKRFIRSNDSLEKVDNWYEQTKSECPFFQQSNVVLRDLMDLENIRSFVGFNTSDRHVSHTPPIFIGFDWVENKRYCWDVSMEYSQEVYWNLRWKDDILNSTNQENRFGE